MIPYGRQDITQADIDAVMAVLKSDWLTQGPMVPRFEQAVAAYCQASHAVAVNSATSALHIACLALGVGPGDWVWTSPNTFVASANCALYCGAQVDFVDIDPRTYNMSVELLAVKLEQAEKSGRLPKVVIPVHYAGQPCDMPAIYKLSQQYGFKIIEDASHAIGASYAEAPSFDTVMARSEATRQSMNQIKVGSCTQSDITIFSFHPVKIITTGEGGMALTNSSELAERMTRHRSHGISSKPEFMQPRPSDEIWNYQQIDIGYNYRMTDIQAALGVSQMNRLDEFVSRRHAIAERYDAKLSGLPLQLPWQHPDTYSSYHLYPLRLQLGKLGKGQRQIYETLHQAGILVNLHYIPVHRQPYYESMGFQPGHCPEAEQFHKDVLTIPMYSAMTDAQQEQVIRVIRAELEPCG